MTFVNKIIENKFFSRQIWIHERHIFKIDYWVRKTCYRKKNEIKSSHFFIPVKNIYFKRKIVFLSINFFRMRAIVIFFVCKIFILEKYCEYKLQTYFKSKIILIPQIKIKNYFCHTKLCFLILIYVFVIKDTKPLKNYRQKELQKICNYNV